MLIQYIVLKYTIRHENLHQTQKNFRNFIWLLISNQHAVLKIQPLEEILWTFFPFLSYWAFHLPPVFMSQNAKTITFGLRPDNQYFPLTASPSLAFISSHDMAASKGVEPRGTGNIKMIGHVVKRSLAKFPEKKIISFEVSHVFMQGTPLPGARFSKVLRTFRAWKASCQTAIRLFWKADLFTCF